MAADSGRCSMDAEVLANLSLRRAASQHDVERRAGRHALAWRGVLKRPLDAKERARRFGGLGAQCPKFRRAPPDRRAEFVLHLFVAGQGATARR